MKSDIKIYGTLVNHTANKTIAYADQILDKQFGDGMMQSEINRRVIGFTPTDTTDIESNISELQSAIEGINGSIAGVNTNVSGLDGRIASVESSLNDAIERLANTRETVGQNLVKITQLGVASTDYGNRITYLELHQGVDQQAFSNYYTKAEVDARIPQYDLSVYYTKTQVDGLILDIQPQDLSNYYTKSLVDNLIEGVSPQDLSSYYTKTQIDQTFTNYYTKAQVDGLVNGLTPQDLSNYYTKTLVDGLIQGITPQDLSDYYTKAQVNSLIDGITPSQNLSISKLTIGEQYDGNTRYGVDLEYSDGDFKISGGFDSVNMLSNLSVNGSLTVSNRNVLDELDALNAFVEEYKPASLDNITRLNIYDQNDDSVYSYIKCEVNVNNDPSIFVPELIVDDNLTTDLLNVSNDGYIANLYVMNLHKFSDNDSYITVNTDFIPANGNECLGTENIPWNGVYTSGLAVSGDVVVGGKLLIGSLTIRDNENNQGHFEVYGDVEDIWVLHSSVFFENIYPTYVKTSKIDFYDATTHHDKTARIEGVYDSASDKTYISVTGQLTVGNRNILNELDVLNTFVENHGSAIDNFFNSTDSLVDMLNNIHVVLLKENSDLGNNITVRCNKFVKDGGDLTVNVYDATGEPSNTYSKTIYNASLVDITDSLNITDGQDGTSFTIEGVEEDLIISIEYQSAVTPPHHPGT